MDIRNFKPLVITFSSMMATFFYTKKRIKRERLRAIQTKGLQQKN